MQHVPSKMLEVTGLVDPQDMRLLVGGGTSVRVETSERQREDVEAVRVRARGLGTCIRRITQRAAPLDAGKGALAQTARSRRGARALRTRVHLTRGGGRRERAFALGASRWRRRTSTDSEYAPERRALNARSPPEPRISLRASVQILPTPVRRKARRHGMRSWRTSSRRKERAGERDDGRAQRLEAGGMAQESSRRALHAA